MNRLAAPLRRWLASRTLGGRLIAGLVTLLAIACAVVGGATYLGLRGFLYGQLDEQLQAAAQRYAQACAHHGPPPPADSKPGGPANSGCGYVNGQAAATLTAQLSH